MFEPRISLLEIVLRVLLIYLFLLVVMRLFGRKEMGRWTPMEFLGMLLLARTVGPALTGGDSSLTVAAVAALTLLGVTFFFDYLVHRSRRLEHLIARALDRGSAGAPDRGRPRFGKGDEEGNVDRATASRRPAAGARRVSGGRLQGLHRIRWENHRHT